MVKELIIHNLNRLTCRIGLNGKLEFSIDRGDADIDLLWHGDDPSVKGQWRRQPGKTT